MAHLYENCLRKPWVSVRFRSPWNTTDTDSNSALNLLESVQKSAISLIDQSKPTDHHSPLSPRPEICFPFLYRSVLNSNNFVSHITTSWLNLILEPFMPNRLRCQNLHPLKLPTPFPFSDTITFSCSNTKWSIILFRSCSPLDILMCIYNSMFPVFHFVNK